MKDKLKEAFDQIHAEEKLKEHTKSFLAAAVKEDGEKTVTRKKSYVSSALLSAALLVLVVGLGGCYFFFTPASVISIDVNPSLELGINRWERVVSVKGMNEDGEAVAESVNVRYLPYGEAVEAILDCDAMAGYVTKEDVTAVSVIGDDEAVCSQMVETIEKNMSSHHGNTYCCHASSDQAAQAHELELSYGKYLAYLELKELDPSVTVEDIRSLSMREIRQWIADLESLDEDGDSGNLDEDEAEIDDSGNDDSSSDDGNAAGNGVGYGNGAGNGSGNENEAGNQNGNGNSSGNGNGAGYGNGDFYGDMDSSYGEDCYKGNNSGHHGGHGGHGYGHE